MITLTKTTQRSALVRRTETLVKPKQKNYELFFVL